ncbi:hypothetical protein BABA_23630 [Neobacillus bataviensis LMG 21833]|uniref:Uncharacterized protein n=1 Tax=Neobacillus bataviensis LMG 21833 TaxID=1117379 RepID=K6BZ11_9BACI|nr:hypothetical protein BABA_23630 [Neobacillus bataviensis LMG 21833]
MVAGLINILPIVGHTFFRLLFILEECVKRVSASNFGRMIEMPIHYIKWGEGIWNARNVFTQIRMESNSA